MLPGWDQWVAGPGTKDTHVVPPARRTLVTRKANLVIAGGVVSGTWSAKNGNVVTEWFPEAGPLPKAALAREVERLKAILDLDLS